MDPANGVGTGRARRRATRPRRALRSLIALAAAGVITGGAVAAGALLRDDDVRQRAAPRPDRRGAPVTTAVTTTVPPPTTVARDPRRGTGQPVTFAFGGDVHFEGGLRSRLASDPQGILAPIAPVLSGADIAVVNLETAITERGAPQQKQFTFRTSPAALGALGAAGVDVVSMANNHSIDYGPDGLADSLAAKAATPAPAVIGIGADAAEAFAPWRTEVRGERIAVFAATDVVDGNLAAAWTATETHAGLASAKNPARLVAAVQAARADSDTIVVFVHWGVDGQTCPSGDQQALARQLVDAGADIVVGGHAHRLQGAGRLGTAFAGYGLGNFVWYNETGDAGVSGVLQVTATGRDVDAYSWAPAHIRAGVPRPLPPGPETDAAVAAWNGLRRCSGLAP